MKDARIDTEAEELVDGYTLPRSALHWSERRLLDTDPPPAVKEVIARVGRYRLALKGQTERADSLEAERDQLKAALTGLLTANGCIVGCTWVHGYADHDPLCIEVRQALNPDHPTGSED